MSAPLLLGAERLTLEQVREVAVGGRRVELSREAVEKIKKSHAFLQAQAQSGDTIYGVNTGFGVLSSVRIADADIETLQYNFLRSHACGAGPSLPDPQVRAMLLLRSANLALGYSGVSQALVEQILHLLNRGVCPIVPEQGSVGASGDLAPLAHLALVLIGEGRARVQGREMSGAQALQAADLKPIRLGAKEGLALTNGTQFMSALGTLAILEAEQLCDIADLAGAMTIEALQGTPVAFSEEIHAIRPHPGQVLVAKRMRDLLLDGGKSEIAKGHENCGKVQDPYSLRCIPQVHGASRDTIAFARQVFEREINSVTDNPLVFPDQKKILSGGNFHGQYLAIALDAVAIAAAEIANISERRIDKLVNPLISGLPAFLTQNSGLNSGFMIVQYAAAAIVSENKTLCHPASVDSIPTSADKEDHVSMGAWGARKCAMVVNNSRRVLSMELLSAAQGIEFLRPLRSTPSIERAHQAIRKRVPKLESDRPFNEDFVAVEQLILDGSLL